MGIANGFRQAAYRSALIVSGGIFVAVGGWLGWKITFLLAAAILALCGVASLRLPLEKIQHPNISISSLGAPFVDLLRRPKAIQVTLFILFYKLSDLAMGPIVRPFWLERGLSTTEIGLIARILGIVAGIAGALTGGISTTRYGILHGLWFLGLRQSVSHGTYVWAAAYPSTGHLGVYIASFSESFCSGLGTAAFLAFLMSICRKEYSATQYALLSALFRITGMIAGTLSGWMAEALGYANYFAVSFFLCLPAFAFIFDVRAWIAENKVNDVSGLKIVGSSKNFQKHQRLTLPGAELQEAAYANELTPREIDASLLVCEKLEDHQSERSRFTAP